jgi:hypothetical protein
MLVLYYRGQLTKGKFKYAKLVPPDPPRARERGALVALLAERRSVLS